MQMPVDPGGCAASRASVRRRRRWLVVAGLTGAALLAVGAWLQYPWPEPLAGRFHWEQQERMWGPKQTDGTLYASVGPYMRRVSGDVLSRHEVIVDPSGECAVFATYNTDPDRRVGDDVSVWYVGSDGAVFRLARGSRMYSRNGTAAHLHEVDGGFQYGTWPGNESSKSAVETVTILWDDVARR